MDFRTRAATAKNLASQTNHPHVVFWNLGGYGVVRADEYSADEHGCAELFVYPAGYKYPNGWEAVLQGESPW